MSAKPMWCDCDHDDDIPDHMADEHDSVLAAASPVGTGNPTQPRADD